MTTVDTSKELDMMQLADSFFPTGLYTTSNGLESWFLSKKITTAQKLQDITQVLIEQQVGPSDCIITSNAYRFAESGNHQKIIELDTLASCLRTIKETRDAAIRSGIQMIKCIIEFQGNDMLKWYYDSIKNKEASGIYPVSFGLGCQSLKIGQEKSLLMLLYGFVTSNVGAALRLGMIQHFEAQKIIHNLKPLILKTAKKSLTKSTDEIWQFCPQAEINQMHHEQLESKVFVT